MRNLISEHLTSFNSTFLVLAVYPGNVLRVRNREPMNRICGTNFQSKGMKHAEIVLKITHSVLEDKNFWGEKVMQGEDRLFVL